MQSSSSLPPSSLPRSDQDRQDHEHALVSVALALLDQILDLVGGGVLTTDKQMTYESKLIPGSTIGKHIRHILDHYSLLLDTLHSPSPSLNYDIRRRLTPIESSLQVAKETVLAVSKRVTNLRSNPSSTSSSTDGWLDRPLTVTAKTPAVLDFESSGGRELWFVSHHSIHHLASLRVIAVGELDLSLPTNFGVAPSTILSRQESDLTSASSSSVPKSKI